MRLDQTIEGTRQMAAIILISQTSKRAKRETQPPVRQRNQASRTREYLTPDEVDRMITTARRAGGRLAERDALLVMIAYRHDLLASELIALRWDQIDLKARTLHIARLRHGLPSTHPLRAPELRALRAWKREQSEVTPYVFTSLRGGPMTRRKVHHVVSLAATAPASSFRSIRTCCAMRLLSI
jgi:integrase